MNFKIINLFTVPQLVRVWHPRMCSLDTANTPLVPLGKKIVATGGRKGVVEILGRLTTEAKRNVFYYVTTPGLMAGFPITNCCLPTTEDRAPSPF